MKRNKKRWDWTPNNLRRTRTHDKRACIYSAPRSFRQIYDQKYAAKDREALINEINGLDGDFSHRTRRGQARWDYW